jgi:protein-tyrosine phosphatase
MDEIEVTSQVPSMVELPPYILFNAINTSKPLLLFDTRSKEKYYEKHICRAIHFPNPSISNIADAITIQEQRSTFFVVLLNDANGTYDLSNDIDEIRRLMMRAKNDDDEASIWLRILSIHRINHDLFDHHYENFSSLFDNNLPNIQIKYPTEILQDQLYLGSVADIMSRCTFETIGITHVVDATGENVSESLCRDFQLSYFPVHVFDDEDENILQYFDVVNDFIFNALYDSMGCKTKSRVFVHCRAGVSRSASLILAYLLIHSEQFRALHDALQFVVSQRPCVCPNDGFITQLIDYERHKLGQSTIADLNEFINLVYKNNVPWLPFAQRIK